MFQMTVQITPYFRTLEDAKSLSVSSLGSTNHEIVPTVQDSMYLFPPNVPGSSNCPSTLSLHCIIFRPLPLIPVGL